MRLNKLFTGALSFFIFGLAGAQPPTNEQLIISSVEAAIERELAADSSSGVLLLSKSEGFERLIEEGIAEGLRSKFTSVVINQAPDSELKHVNYDIQGFDFNYEKGSSRGFLKGRRIKREFRGQLRITIKGGMNNVLLDTRDIGISYTDQVEPADLDYVKSRHFTELAPQAPGSGWSRYAEPSLVIASVGALVYLFFANR